MRYSEKLGATSVVTAATQKMITIHGTIPLVYRRYRQAYPFIFTDTQLFSLVFQAWWRFHLRDNWASQLYLVTESIPASAALFTHPRAPDDYYHMINSIFDAVNADSAYLDRFFQRLLEHLVIDQLILNGITTVGEEFTITFTGVVRHVNSYRHQSPDRPYARD